MRAIITTTLICAAISTQAMGQDWVQKQQQEQFQAEQNRLGYEQEQNSLQQPGPQPYRFGPHIPYVHSAFAATPSGKGWGVGFSEHTDAEAEENAKTECEKTTNTEKCDVELNGDSYPKAVVAEYLNDEPDKVHNWFYESSEIDPEDALRIAMGKCASDKYTGSPHHCVPVVTWNAPAMSEGR